LAQHANIVKAFWYHATLMDINHRAAEIVQEQVAQRAEAERRVLESHTSGDEPEPQELANEAAIRGLTQQFHDWATSNSVPTNWRHHRSRGWVIGVEGSETAFYNPATVYSRLVVLTNGSLLYHTDVSAVSAKEILEYFLRSHPVEQIQECIAAYVAQYGHLWTAE
jgi:hypothetical protein